MMVDRLEGWKVGKLEGSKVLLREEIGYIDGNF